MPITEFFNVVAALGTQEIVLLVVVLLLLFGGTKIPQLMRGVGRGVGELQKGLDEGKRAFTANHTTDDDLKDPYAPIDTAERRP